MSDELSTAPQHDEALPADLAAVQQHLLRDGNDWRQQIPVSARLQQYVMTRGPRQAASPILHEKQGYTSMATRPTSTAAGTHPRRSWTTFPLIGIALMVALVSGYFGFQALHATKTTPGVGTDYLPTHTPSPRQWFSLTQVVYTKGAPTPLENFALGNDYTTPQHLSVETYADPQKVHTGDTLTVVWKLNGVTLTGPQCCHFQLSPMQNSTEFIVPVTTTGTGSVTISYNTILTYTATFTVVASSTPPVIPATPTTTSSH